MSATATLQTARREKIERTMRFFMQVAIVSKFVSTLARRNLSFFHLRDDSIRLGGQVIQFGRWVCR